MRKTVLSMLVVALLLGGLGSGMALADPSPAAPKAKPVVVVSLAGYDELIGDVEMVGNLSGRPSLVRMLEGAVGLVTQGKGLAGLNKSKPWGVALYPTDKEPKGYAFLPVDDIEAFHDVAKPYIGEVEDLGGGIYKVPGKDVPQTVFVKHVDSGWLFVSDNAEVLADTPRNPVRLLGGKHKQYDLSVTLLVGNVPEDARSMLLAQMKQEMDRQIERDTRNDPQAAKFAKAFGDGAYEAIKTALNNLDEISLGWSLDQSSSRAMIDLSVTAKEGTDCAAALGKLADAKSDFAGFLVPGAALSNSVAMQCPFASPGDLAGLFDMIGAAIADEIDKNTPTASQADAAKEIVAGLLEVTEKTMATGRVEGAGSLILRPDAATLVAGRYIADGQKLEDTLGLLVEAVRAEHPGFVDQVLKTDVGEFQGVRFHTVSIPLPGDMDDREKAVKALGEVVEVVVGIGDDSVYVAAGKNAMSALKDALAKSAAQADEAATPMVLTVSVREFARFFAAHADGGEAEKAQKFVDALKDAGDTDRVVVSAEAIDNGVRLRLEVQEGLLKLIGAMSKQ